MARRTNPWFRFYTEAFSDPKIRRLKLTERWLWLAVLGAARESCQPGRLMVSERIPMTTRELAAYGDIPERQVVAGLERMVDLDMVRLTGDPEAWTVVHWSDRQYESDDTTQRTRKHRSKERSNDVPGNPPETETETEKEEETEQRAENDDVRLVFDAWVLHTGRTGKTILDAKRRRLIKNALRMFPLEEVMQAVHGVSLSKFHMGENTQRRKYDDLDVVLRDASQIETFRDLSQQNPRLVVVDEPGGLDFNAMSRAR